MYHEDSLFTLSQGQILGLLILSVVLCVGMTALSYWSTRRLPLWGRAGFAIGLIYLFLWLSPQIYYTYYRAVIPGLPAQWVIRTAPGLSETLGTLTFSYRATLADHGRGVLCWAILIAAVLRRPAEKD